MGRGWGFVKDGERSCVEAERDQRGGASRAGPGCLCCWALKTLLGIYPSPMVPQGFPGSSVGKESTCNAGDPGSIPGLGRSPGEGLGYPLWFSWASLVAQLVKNLLAMSETWVWALGWEDPLEKGKATHFSILAWRISWTHKESDRTEQLFLLVVLLWCFKDWTLLSFSELPNESVAPAGKT